MAKKGKKKGKIKWNQIWFSLRIWIRDNNFAISTVLTVLAIVLIIFSGLAIFVYDTNSGALPQPIRDWVGALHGGGDPDAAHVDLCLFPLGALLIIFTGYYMVAGILKRREFNALMDTESKSEFIENLDDLEEIAWRLGTKYEVELAEKKEEFGIRRKKRR